MDLWVFDNDGTLYNDSMVEKQFMRILTQYVSELLNIELNRVPAEILLLKKKWNTDATVLALAKEQIVGFAKFVSDTYLKIKLEECNIVAPDITRFAVLDSIKSNKVVLTNNPATYARYVLSYIGLADCFIDIIGFEETGFYGKPNMNAYKAVENRHRGYQRIIFCDDSLTNLEAARKLGWITIWYKPPNMNSENGKDHLVINSFEELKKLL